MTVQYCEQLTAIAGFEPWNSISNVAFIMAGVAAWAKARSASVAIAGSTLALIGFAFLIGAGSFAWHATHQGWAEFADVIPILCFVLLFMYLAIRRLLQLGRIAALIASAGMFAAIASIIVIARTALNGSAAYLPVLVCLMALAVLAPAAESRAHLRLAAALFAMSLTARTIDLALCADFPLGTHWLWHVLNGAVIFLALAAVIAITDRDPAEKSILAK